MYSKEGWGCPPFLSYILDLFFFRSQDCILPGICFDALCNEKWFWNTQHFWKIVKSRNMQKHCKQKNKKLETQNTKRKTKNKTRTPNTNHKINKTAQTPGFDWFILPFLCFSLVNLHIECFLVIWCVLIVLFFCFSVFVEVKFLCWNRCHSSRSNERNRVCIQPNPAISNHIYPRYNHIYPPTCILRMGEPVPPSFHTFWPFFFSWLEQSCI